MISLEQVLLLQKKVDTAVEKISALGSQVKQLNLENDALRRKCAELTKALSDKSELVSSLESDQDRIEQGILVALSRLDTVENAVLSGSSSAYNSMVSETVNSEEASASNISDSVSTEGTHSASESAETVNGNFDIY